MRVFVDADEAAERFEELIGLVVRGDQVVICRAGKPVAELTAIPKGVGTMDDVWTMAAERQANVQAGTISNHDEFDDEHGLPK